MIRLFSILFVLGLSLTSIKAEPVRLILDTDIGNDIDDALAIAMIHALQSRGEVQLLAVTITKDNRDAAPFVALLNQFYGRPDIPIGMVRNGKTPEDAPLLKADVYKKNANGALAYPRSSKAPAEAVELLTKVLQAQPDHSVTIAQIGFSTNLARLIETSAGRALVQQKVKLLSLMAGNFAKPEPEYNVYTDGPSASKLFADWPTPMVFSGYEVGLVITYPGESIRRDFGYVPNHPVADAYRAMLPDLKDRPNWDSTAVLYAIRPDRGYFDLSDAGSVKLGPKNTTEFQKSGDGKCRYLVIKPDQVQRVRQLMVDLVSEPPHASSGGR